MHARVNGVRWMAESGRSSLLSTRELLILAGERLFAENGIEAVTLREVARAAGNGNNNAVQYHFGSRQGLLQAIFSYRISQLHTPRSRLLEAARADGKERDLRTLVEAWLLPLVDIKDAGGRHTYAGFMAQYLLRYPPDDMPYAAASSDAEVALLQCIVALVSDALPFVPPALLEQRIQLGYLMFANMLVRYDCSEKTADKPEFRQLVQDVIACVVASLSTPVPTAGKP